MVLAADGCEEQQLGRVGFSESVHNYFSLPLVVVHALVSDDRCHCWPKTAAACRIFRIAESSPRPKSKEGSRVTTTIAAWCFKSLRAHVLLTVSPARRAPRIRTYVLRGWPDQQPTIVSLFWNFNGVVGGNCFVL